MKILLTLIALLLPFSANAEDAALTITEAYSRPTMGEMMMGVVFLKATNGTDSAIVITGVESSVASKVEMHVTEQNDKGVMKMRQVESLEVPAHGALELKPGGTHLMLIGLKEKLKVGDSFPLTLHYGDAKTLEVTAAVKELH